MEIENQHCKERLLPNAIHSKHRYSEKKSFDGCSYFFKVMLGDFAEKLRIPPSFIPKLIHETDENMVLQGPNGKQWDVKLWGTSTELVFGQGWENFVHHHRVELGDFLVFKYACSSHFKVRIFGRSGCEKNISVCDPEETHYDLQQKRCPATPSGSAGLRRFDQPMNSHFPIDLVSDEVKGIDEVAENRGKKRKPKPSSSSRSTPTPKCPKHCQPSLVGKERKLVKLSSKTQTEERRYLGIYYVSRRRPVTEAERNQAFKAANSFRSDKPFCLVLMRPSHVYQGFILGLPKNSISHLQLPRKTMEMTLVDPNSKEWHVKYLWNSHKASLSGGWGHFSRANNLEEGDACVFERVDNNKQNFKLRVHIFRVVKTCTPYKRMESIINKDSITLPTNHSKKMKVFKDDIVTNLSAKALGPEGKHSKQGIKELEKMNGRITLPTNHSKKMKVSKEDLATNLSAKASRLEQRKDGKQGIEQVKKEKSSNGDNCPRFSNSKCTPAISERKAGCRRSPRFAQTYNMVTCSTKELLHHESSVDGHKSIGKNTTVLSKMTASLADVNAEEEDLMIIWDSNNLSKCIAS